MKTFGDQTNVAYLEIVGVDKVILPILLKARSSLDGLVRQPTEEETVFNKASIGASSTILFLLITSFI